MAGARGIRLDETEAIELALLKSEQIVASSQEQATLLRRLLALARGGASPSSRARDNKPRSHKPRGEQDDDEDSEEIENDESMPVNGRGALLHLPPNTSEPALTLDDIDDEGRYNVNQAALVLSRSAYTIRQWIKEDKMQAEREGRGKGQFFVSGSEIRRHAAERN